MGRATTAGCGDGEMRIAGGAAIGGVRKKADVGQGVPAMRRRPHRPRGQVEFTHDHSACQLEQLSTALELPRASGAAHECVRIEEIHPVSSASELDEHHASRVELEQIHPVGRIERIEPHGTTPTASAFLGSSSLYKSESTGDRDPALHALWYNILI